MWKLFKREVHHACKAVVGCGLLCGMVGVSSALAQEVWQDSLRSSRGVSLTMPYSDMALSARFIGPAVSDKDWYIWCFSPIWGKDGKVHAFCSRWPAAEGMEAADAAAAPGKEGVQQLEQGSNYDWGLPCCRQKLPAVQFLLRFRGIRLRLLHDVGVVLQN